MSLQMIKAKIKIDIDNVLNNLTATTIDLYNERHGTSYCIDDCTDYDFTNFDRRMSDELVSMFSEPELYERLRPAAHAVKYLFLMIREFDVKIVTSTRPSQMRLKVDWLQKWFPYVNDHDIIMAIDKKWIEADYAIDDHVGYLLGDGAKRILIDMPWNRRVLDYAYGISRVGNLEEAYQIIKTLEKEMEEQYKDEDEI